MLREKKDKGKTKNLKCIVAVILAVLMLRKTALADSHSTDMVYPEASISDWTKDEVVSVWTELAE